MTAFERLFSWLFSWLDLYERIDYFLAGYHARGATVVLWLVETTQASGGTVGPPMAGESRVWIGGDDARRSPELIQTHCCQHIRPRAGSSIRSSATSPVRNEVSDREETN